MFEHFCHGFSIIEMQRIHGPQNMSFLVSSKAPFLRVSGHLKRRLLFLAIRPLCFQTMNDDTLRYPHCYFFMFILAS